MSPRSFSLYTWPFHCSMNSMSINPIYHSIVKVTIILQNWLMTISITYAIIILKCPALTLCKWDWFSTKRTKIALFNGGKWCFQKLWCIKILQMKWWNIENVYSECSRLFLFSWFWVHKRDMHQITKVKSGCLFDFKVADNHKWPGMALLYIYMFMLKKRVLKNWQVELYEISRCNSLWIFENIWKIIYWFKCNCSIVVLYDR